ncbi:unnamed protein product [Closterium sp. NIES-54]
MLALCREHRLEHRTKHIALRYFLARELQQRGQLRLAYVASEANTADIFTKALAPGDHQRFCTMLDCVTQGKGGKKGGKGGGGGGGGGSEGTGAPGGGGFGIGTSTTGTTPRGAGSGSGRSRTWVPTLPEVPIAGTAAATGAATAIPADALAAGAVAVVTIVAAAAASQHPHSLCEWCRPCLHSHLLLTHHYPLHLHHLYDHHPSLPSYIPCLVFAKRRQKKPQPP